MMKKPNTISKQSAHFGLLIAILDLQRDHVVLVRHLKEVGAGPVEKETP